MTGHLRDCLRFGLLLLGVTAVVPSCVSGSWQASSSSEYDDSYIGEVIPPPERVDDTRDYLRVRALGPSERPLNPFHHPSVVSHRIALARAEGDVRGKFRNTYYHFPSEKEFSGDDTPLFDARCRKIADVKTAFHDSVCVQGSGVLATGGVVSFAKRNCRCARKCPRTDQKICYEKMDSLRYPWGRGAAGKPITPLTTVAVDTNVIPMGTHVYIPEFEGLPRLHGSSETHDGCFVAEDRGLMIKGQHVDIFTGSPPSTRLYNRLVPSNVGITVVMNSPKCKRAVLRSRR